MRAQGGGGLDEDEDDSVDDDPEVEAFFYETAKSLLPAKAPLPGYIVCPQRIASAKQRLSRDLVGEELALSWVDKSETGPGGHRFIHQVFVLPATMFFSGPPKGL